MSMCPSCNGTGIIVTCCDDMCNTRGSCFHGDGDEMCDECGGEGDIRDDYDDYDDCEDSPRPAPAGGE